jgi:hypothetical protein
VLRVWDILFSEGVQVVFVVAIALFKIHEEALLQMEDCFKIMQYMKESTLLCFDADQLVRARFSALSLSLSLSALSPLSLSLSLRSLSLSLSPTHTDTHTHPHSLSLPLSSFSFLYLLECCFRTGRLRWRILARDYHWRRSTSAK